jgi:hypothetical protein
MSVLGQFLLSFLGAAVGIAVGSVFFKRSRWHLIRAICVALAVAFALPIDVYWLGTWKYGIVVLPLLGGALGGIGWSVGILFEHWLKRRQEGN